MVNHHFTVFGDHLSGTSGDIKYSIYHVLSQNQVIEGPCNFTAKSSSLYVTTLRKYYGHRCCGNRDIVFHVIYITR